MLQGTVPSRQFHLPAVFTSSCQALLTVLTVQLAALPSWLVVWDRWQGHALASPALNTQTREKKNMQLQDKRTDLKRFIEDAQREMQQKSQTELSNLRQDIMPVIEKIGKEKGFTIILDLTTSGIAYFDSAIDITADVIAEYDKKYSK